MRLSLATLFIILSSCTTVGVNHLTKDLQPKDSSCKPDFYIGQNEVETKFVRVCDIQSNIGIFNSTTTPRADALKNARKLLCDCGADGVIFLGSGPGTFQRPASFVGVIYDTKPSNAPATYDLGITMLKCLDTGGHWLNDQCDMSHLQNELDMPNQKRRRQI